MRRLEGKAALITGAGQGVGLGIARAFVAEGASVTITGRNAERLEAALAEIKTVGGKAVACRCDAGVRESAEQAVKATVEAFGRIDVVVNNAQARRSGVPMEDITEADMDLAFRSGPYATLFHMQAAFPYMKEHGGSIINFGSKMGLLPMAGIGSYASAKEAIRGLTRAAAREWGQYRIRVNVLNPASLSDSGKAYFANRTEEFERLCKDVALGYFGDAVADIGPAAVFLASDDSRYVTGQTINVDGGQLML
jgi:NAD(P)-dependent dehydrogenase (short-subunit alcohol dehydrogenase family)